MNYLITDEPILKLPNGIEIRAMRDEDAAALSKHASDPKVFANLSDSMPQPYGVQEARDYICYSRRSESFKPTGPSLEDTSAVRIPTKYAIVVDGEPCGGIGLDFRTGVYRLTANMGYWLGTAYQYQGVMSAVAPAFAQWAWATFGWMTRMDGTAYEFNKSSQKVLERAGFVYEGLRINACIKLGVIHNEVMMGAYRPGVKAFPVQ